MNQLLAFFTDICEKPEHWGPLRENAPPPPREILGITGCGLN